MHVHMDLFLLYYPLSESAEHPPSTPPNPAKKQKMHEHHAKQFV